MDGGTDHDLDGNIALVTGASRGLGAAIAIALARRGAHVVIAARDDGGLTVTDDAIRALGGEATLLPADLTRAEVTDSIGASLFERFGRLDILVHAAAVLGTPGPAGKIDEAEWEAAFGINATATWRLIRTTEPLLRAAPHGRVVVLTHSAASVPEADGALRGASMAARQILVLSWAAELNETNLRVNLFDPTMLSAAIEASATVQSHTVAQTVAQTEAMAQMIVAMCQPSEARHGEILVWPGT
ncbi:MAG: SDR family NAD(P)-dependent oxidoreductase [Acidiphilium sp.]|nr:SDR family NAD(P)-dependent oxidoreductase [Acidiphilium sp.]MDD4934716.1 SDR family NAD(P)-dependent oxidoreductase [Acidiphilium sp.]